MSSANKLSEAEMDALFESAMAAKDAPAAPAQDPAWLAKSKRGQEAARTSVEAEDLLREPSWQEKAAAFSMGAGESASMGTAPFVRGITAASTPGPLDPASLAATSPLWAEELEKGAPERYQEGRGKQREAKEAFSSEKLGSSFGYGQGLMDALNAALGLVAPAKSAVTALEDVASGAKVGDVLSTGAPKVIDKVKAYLKKGLEKAGSRADEKRAMTVLGGKATITPPALLDEVNRIPGGMSEFANRLRDTGISKGITTLGSIEKKSGQLLSESGEQIGKFIDDADVGGGFVDVPTLARRLREEASAIAGKASGVSVTERRRVAQLNDYADAFESLITNAPKPNVPGLSAEQIAVIQRMVASGNDTKMIANATKIPEDLIAAVPAPGRIPVSEMKDFSIKIGKDAQSAYKAEAAGNPVSGMGEAMMDTRRAAEDAVGEAIERTGQSVAAYNDAKRINQVSRLASGLSKKALGRADVNNPVSLLDVGLAQISAPLAAVRMVLKPFGSSIRATMAETARDLATTLQNPAAVAALGPNGPILKQAAEQGPEALKAALASMAMYGGEIQAPPDQSMMGQMNARLGRP